MPILWGFMIDVHSKVAMAPSTAEPPNCSISLGEKKRQKMGYSWGFQTIWCQGFSNLIIQEPPSLTFKSSYSYHVHRKQAVSKPKQLHWYCSTFLFKYYLLSWHLFVIRTIIILSNGAFTLNSPNAWSEAELDYSPSPAGSWWRCIFRVRTAVLSRHHF